MPQPKKHPKRKPKQTMQMWQLDNGQMWVAIDMPVPRDVALKLMRIVAEDDEEQQERPTSQKE